MFIKTENGFINTDKSKYLVFSKTNELEIGFIDSVVTLFLTKGNFLEARERIKRGILAKKRIVDLTDLILHIREVVNGTEREL